MIYYYFIPFHALIIFNMAEFFYILGSRWPVGPVDLFSFFFALFSLLPFDHVLFPVFHSYPFVCHSRFFAGRGHGLILLYFTLRYLP